MTKKIYALVLTAAVALFILSACDKPDEIVSEVESIDVPEPTPEPFPVIIGDVQLNARPESIVSLSPSITEILYEMGYGDYIIARSIYCDYPSAVTSKEDIGSSANPNINKIIELKPDLVLSKSPLANKDIIAMNNKGIKVCVLPSPETLEELQRIYRLIGFIFEGKLTGEQTGDSAYKYIGDSTERAVNTGKTFVYITTEFAVATGDTIENAILSLFGTNIAVNAKDYKYSFEEILENQPYYVFVSDIYGAVDLEEHETLSQLNAVVSGRVITINNEYFERPTSRLADLIMQIKSKLALIESGETESASETEPSSETETTEIETNAE